MQYSYLIEEFVILIQGYNELKIYSLCIIECLRSMYVCVKLQSFGAINLVKGYFSCTISVPT